MIVWCWCIWKRMNCTFEVFRHHLAREITRRDGPNLLFNVMNGPFVYALIYFHPLHEPLVISRNSFPNSMTDVRLIFELLPLFSFLFYKRKSEIPSNCSQIVILKLLFSSSCWRLCYKSITTTIIFCSQMYLINLLKYE